MFPSKYMMSTVITPLNQILNGAVCDLVSGPPGSSASYAAQTAKWNTVLASFAFASPAFGTFHVGAHRLYATANLAQTTFTPVARGDAAWGVIRPAARADIVYATTLVGEPWRPNQTVGVSHCIFANGSTYLAVEPGKTAASGSGPSGNGSVIIDGSVVWGFMHRGAPDILLWSTLMDPAKSFSVPVIQIGFHAYG